MPVVNRFNQEVTAKIKLAKATTAPARKDILNAIGVQVLSWVWQEYRKKGRGGTDVWGTQWAPLAPGTLAARLGRLASHRKKGKAAKAKALGGGHEIGVDTGRLINSLQFGKPGNVSRIGLADITLGTSIKYAKHFDRLRRIFPVQLTAQQIAKLQAIAAKIWQRYVDKAVKGGA